MCVNMCYLREGGVFSVPFISERLVRGRDRWSLYVMSCPCLCPHVPLGLECVLSACAFLTQPQGWYTHGTVHTLHPVTPGVPADPTCATEM